MPPDERIESTLMWFRHGDDNGNWQSWVARLEDHLADYKNKTFVDQADTHAVECGELGSKSPGTEGICRINQEELFGGPCTSDNNYGFKEGKPCILIKLNKIYQWEPEPYETIEDLPEDIPQTIKSAFENNINAGKPELVSASLSGTSLCNACCVFRTSACGWSVTARTPRTGSTSAPSPTSPPTGSPGTSTPTSTNKDISVQSFLHVWTNQNVRMSINW